MPFGFELNPFRSKKSAAKTEKADTDPFAGMQWAENPIFQPEPETSQTPFLDMAGLGGAAGVGLGLTQAGKTRPKDLPKAKHKLEDRHVKTRHRGKDGIAKSANEVQRIDYERSIGNSGQTTGFFKAAQKDPKSDHASFAGIGKYDDNGQIAGDPNLGARGRELTPRLGARPGHPLRRGVRQAQGQAGHRVGEGRRRRVDDEPVRRAGRPRRTDLPRSRPRQPAVAEGGVGSAVHGLPDRTGRSTPGQHLRRHRLRTDHRHRQRSRLRNSPRSAARRATSASSGKRRSRRRSSASAR